MNPFDRVFALHRLLDGRRTTLSLADIEHHLECSRATAKRAIAHLRDMLGAPLYFDRDGGGYRYRADERFEMPGLWFSARELAALLSLAELLAAEPSGLLAETLHPFQARLEQLLEREGVGLPDWRHRLLLMRAQARTPGEFFGIVAGALAQRRRLSIRYFDRTRESFSDREISPQRLMLYRDNWYLDAWCHLRDGLRRFAVERLISAENLEATAYEVDDQELDTELGAGYGIFAGPADTWAELRFSAFATRWVADELWHPQQQDEHFNDGSMIRRLPYHRAEELVMDVLRHGAEAEVLAPDSLREELARRLERALTRYRS